MHGTLIGEGPERAAIEGQISASGLNQCISLLGQVSNAEVFNHLRSAHLLVSTSVGEPYGRSIAEAMAVGTPAVCHRSGGPAEFVTHEKDGLLVGETTAAAYASAILPVVASPAGWEFLAEGAVRKAADWRSEDHIQRMRLKFGARRTETRKHERESSWPSGGGYAYYGITA